MTLELAWLHRYRLLKAKRRRYRRFTAALISALELDLPGLTARIGGFGAAAASVRRPKTGYGPFSAAQPRNAARPERRGRHRAKQPTLREHLTDRVDRRRHLAQHLQHARVMVPPFERGLELVEIKHDVPQVIRSRLLARSAS